MSTNKKFKVVTLGCRTNQYEAQAYIDQLKALGYSSAEESEQADICIVNTCTVTESADSSSRYQIRHLVRQNPKAEVIVTGCLAEREPEKIKGLPGVTHVVRNQNKEQLLSVLFPGEDLPEFSIQNFADHTRAFVKVQDGCNSFCTYCIIPYVRGRSRSRRLQEILEEIRALIKNGYKEVVLTGINIGDFDGAPKEEEAPVRLSGLVDAVDQLEGLERIRVSSIDPDEVDDELLQAIVKGKKTCPSMHIVLQSGSNAILKRMNRKYTRQMFLAAVNKLKKASPAFTFTTDVIVGFPGETEADFQETLEMIREVKFAKVHMFPYSERERTRAALYPNKVPSDVMYERKQRLLREAEHAAFNLREEFLGETCKILIEGDEESMPGYVSGHTDNFLNVFIPSKGMKKNTVVEVKLIENLPKGFLSKPLGVL